MEASTDSGRRLAAYALWLEDRGLSTAPAVAGRLAHSRPAAVALPPAPLAAVPSTGTGTGTGTASRDTANTETTSTGSRLLFVSARPLTADESELLARVLAALHLTPEQAPTVAADTVEAIQAATRRYAPSVIVLLGGAVLRSALGAKASFRQLAGRVFFCTSLSDDAALIATLHPADLLRYPGNKRQAWLDLQLAAEQAKAKVGVGAR